MRTKTTLLLYKSRHFGQKSDVSEHYEFDYRKSEKKKRNKKKEKRGGHIIKCLLTELGRAGPPTQSISTYCCIMIHKCLTVIEEAIGET